MLKFTKKQTNDQIANHQIYNHQTMELSNKFQQPSLPPSLTQLLPQPLPQPPLQPSPQPPPKPQTNITSFFSSTQKVRQNRRVNFSPSHQERRSKKFDSQELIRRIFIFLVMVAIFLSIWYLLSSIVIKPIKNTIQEEGLTNIKREQHESTTITNISTFFSNALNHLNITNKKHYKYDYDDE